MRLRLCPIAICFALSAINAQSPPPLPTWHDEIAKNFLPYHQITTADFPIDDSAHPETSFWLGTFLHYYYHSLGKSTPGGVIYAYVTDWTIFSGLDKNQTSRRSKAGNIKDDLPYAQAILDLNEIYARQMAALPPGELPSGRGDSLAAAQADLDARVKTFYQERSKTFNTEKDAFVKETERGQNKKKVRELAAAIKKRLDATPATPAPSRSPTVSPAPSTTTAPSAR